MKLRRLKPLMLPVLALPALWIIMRLVPVDAPFKTPQGTLLLDRDGDLLGALVAADGQWRLAPAAGLPEKFRECIIEFEDRHFHSHQGIHLPSLLRAWRQNHRAGRTVSGGSTITMQLARMSGGGGGRTYTRKIGEMWRAIRLEMHFEKDTLLALYAANAPFGANVVGLEAAAWRWFGRPPAALGWAENALLAVLPNAPALLHPGRNRDALRAKRDRLLQRLHEKGSLDELEYSLALEEPLPDAPLDLPRRAPHLLSTLAAHGGHGTTLGTTIEGRLQDRITTMAARYAATLQANEVHNAAVLVMEVESGNVLAYVGNLTTAGREHAPEVDVVQARRSTGSLLKPFLYADMLQTGELMPDQLVADLPTHFEGFSPKNFDRRHEGAVPASQALARSLNVPAVRALHQHGIERTIKILRGMGLHHVDRSAGHYGLSLIVGGAESTLWELTGAYASLARTVIRYGGHGSVDASVVHPPVIKPRTAAGAGDHAPPPITAPAAWHTLMALQELNRPETQQGWQHFGGERIAWKTGTSFGHRDAWAIGITTRYAVGVWTGNASGEGRPGLTGTLAAAPLMFEIFGILPNGEGFHPPYDDLARLAVCRTSGHRASAECHPVDTLWTIAQAVRTDQCPWHRTVLVDTSRRYRIGPSPGAEQVPWFVLPPAMELYYAVNHPEYRSLPPFKGDHPENLQRSVMEMIYPTGNSRIHVAMGLDGTHGRVVMEVAHRERDAVVYWDLDGQHLGATRGEHRLPLDLQAGPHRLTLTDHLGRSIATSFHVQRSGTTGHR